MVVSDVGKYPGIVTEDGLIECTGCNHYFHDDILIRNLSSRLRPRRNPARARMADFHYYHQVANKTCICHRVCD